MGSNVQSYWKDAIGYKGFMDSLEKQLNIKNKEEWYGVSLATLKRHGAAPLLEKYNHSMYTLLAHIYPELTWDPAKFHPIPQLPKEHWYHLENHHSFIHHMCEELNITQQQEWFKISQHTLQQYGSARLMKYYGSIGKLLTTLSPQYKQICREFVFKMMNEWKLSKVEDTIKIPMEYPQSNL